MTSDHCKAAIITAGPTRVRLDAVRFIMNSSTGALGVALAAEGAKRGWQIELLRGPFTADLPVESTWSGIVNQTQVAWLDQLIPALEDVETRVSPAVIFHAMAVLDYAPHMVDEGKRPSGIPWHVELSPTPKIIDLLPAMFPGARLVGFKLERGIDRSELVRRAALLGKRTHAEVVVANLQEWVGKDHYRCLIVDRSERIIAEISGREQLAAYLWNLVDGG